MMSPAPWPLVVLMGVLGLAVGSFLNVVIYRVPREESLIAPGSHCPRCDTPIKSRHNVPVLGWLVLRGKCAACRAPISPRYPLVEAATGALFVGITLRFGLTAQLPAFLYLAAIAIALAMIDFDVRRLPDSILLPSYVVGVLFLLPAGAATDSWWDSGRALVGMVGMLAVFFALALAYPRGVTFGVVKLAGLVGLYLGWLSWSALLITAFGGFLIVAATGTAAAVTTRGSTRSVSVPLAPCLISAAVLALFVAVPVAGWYGALVTV